MQFSIVVEPMAVKISRPRRLVVAHQLRPASIIHDAKKWRGLYGEYFASRAPSARERATPTPHCTRAKPSAIAA